MERPNFKAGRRDSKKAMYIGYKGDSGHRCTAWAAQPTVMQVKPWKGGVGDTTMLALEKGRTQVSFVLLRSKAWL